MISNNNKFKHIILVLSGKGGVGKSTVSSQLALCLAQQGQKVGLLDIDLCGPSIPRMLGLENCQVQQTGQGWLPVVYNADPTFHLVVMSIAFLLTDKNSAVIWRGPKKNAFIQQLFKDVCWGELDYLIIDTPPGTSDEHLSATEVLANYNPDGAIIVTTPQAISLSDVMKEISFCKKINLPILGIIENMSGFVCPHCTECYNLFSKGGGEQLAKQLSLPFIGPIPIDPALTNATEQGNFFCAQNPQSNTLHYLQNFVRDFISKNINNSNSNNSNDNNSNTINVN
eukprot:TRINITY_DN422_c0_g1_i1.p1 TRINITY_DN422_c0_g1~~TRINITY_DN422_c0_g1_i1.p1  ORF type:complete len:284 (-),score=129.73 TRINITY_DN422_c0_g1_i1:103-954(-)